MSGQDPSRSVWEYATQSEIETALKGVRFSVTAQDSDFRYVGGINSPFAGKHPSLDGLSDTDLFKGSTGRDLTALKQRVRQSGHGEAIDFCFDGGVGTGWYRIWAEPLADSGEGVLCASVDISEQKVAEEHLRLALLELAHRSKNLLSVVLSIARQSAEESRTLDEFNRHFVGRIQSLALAHDVLTDERWRGATLFSLVRSQLAAFSEAALAQASMEGHNAFLKPNAVQHIGLALHELCALSLLSGALSTADGRVEVSASLRASGNGNGGTNPNLIFRWHEVGTRQVSYFDQAKFGRALLERLVPLALGGRGKLEDLGPEELAYELSVPSSQFF